MKRWIYFCLILALALGLSTVAFAAGNEKVTITGKDTLESGNAEIYTVMVSNADPVRSCEIQLVDFPEDLELRSWDWILSSDLLEETTQTGYRISWNEDTNINGKLAEICVTLKAGYTSGKAHTISCKITVTTGDGQTLEYTDVCPITVTVPCTHTYAQVADKQYLKQSGSCTESPVYYVSCSICGVAGTDTFTLEGEATHDFTGKVETEAYLSSKGDCKNGAVYYYSCTVCGARGEETFVAEGATGHDFTAKVESEEYLCGEVSCQSSLVYYYSCAVCGEKGEETFTVEGTGTHDFTAQVETEEYLSDMGDCQNKRQYFYSCTVCGEKSEQTFVSEKKFGVHIYDNDCDSECNVCGKYQEPSHLTEDKWESDQTGHWRTCTVCEEKVEFAAHIPGAEATAEEHQTCTECGYVLAVSDEHQHEYGASWSSDEKSHWHECSCGGKSDLDVHSWSVLETEDSSVLTAECLVCGATKEEKLPDVEDTQPTQPATTQPSTTQPTQPDSQEKDDGSVAAVIVLSILLVLSLTGNGVLAWMLFGKKKPGAKKNV